MDEIRRTTGSAIGSVSQSRPIQNANNNIEDVDSQNIITAQSDEEQKDCPELNNSEEVNTLVSNLENTQTATNQTSKEEGFFSKCFSKAKSFFKDVLKVDQIAQKAVEFAIGKNFPVFHKVAEFMVGKNAAGMLDLAHENVSNKSFLDNAVELKNYDDSNVEEMKDYLKNKIDGQLSDYNLDSSKIKGYRFNKNSTLSKDIAKDESLYNAIKKNISAIDSNQNFCMEFSKDDSSSSTNSNLHDALGKVDVINPKFSENGNLTMQVCDVYDFNKNSTDILNKAGASQMEKGNLIPYFSVVDVEVPKETIDKIRQEIAQEK